MALTEDHIWLLKIIQRIRESFDGSVEVFTQGSCVKFAMILKQIFPDGRTLSDLNHAIFELQGMCFNVNGIANKTRRHIPLEDYGILQCYDSMNLKYSKK